MTVELLNQLLKTGIQCHKNGLTESIMENRNRTEEKKENCPPHLFQTVTTHIPQPYLFAKSEIHQK